MRKRRNDDKNMQKYRRNRGKKRRMEEKLQRKGETNAEVDKIIIEDRQTHGEQGVGRRRVTEVK